PEAIGQPGPESHEPHANGSARLDESVFDEAGVKGTYLARTQPPRPGSQPGPESHEPHANGSARLEESVSDEAGEKSPYWSEPEPRWPESPPPRPRESRPESRESRPARSPYPLPSRNNVRGDSPRSG